MKRSQSTTSQGQIRRPPESTPPCTMWKSDAHRLVTDLMRPMEPTAPGDNRAPSPAQKPIHALITPTTHGRTQTFPGSILTGTMGKRHPYWPTYGWLGLMDPARGKSFATGHRRGPATPGDDRAPSRIKLPPIYLQIQHPPGQLRKSLGSIPLSMVWDPHPYWVISDSAGDHRVGAWQEFLQ